MSAKVATGEDFGAVAACLIVVVLAAGCRMPGSSVSPPPTSKATYAGADTLRPDSIWQMPPELNEISALAIGPSGELLTLQDEDGDVYAVDSTGHVVGKTRLAGDGDFEALAAWDSLVVAVRSDGRLYVSDGADDSRRFDLDLHSSCDLESADIRPGSRNLWLGCKEHPGRRLGRTRAFYTVSLDALMEGDGDLEPVLALRLAAPPSPRTGKEMIIGRFKPSALAFIDQDRFLVVSSVYPALFEYRVDGALLNSWTLPEEDLRQPEGIALDASGRLFIASEGRPGVIAVFNSPVR